MNEDDPAPRPGKKLGFGLQALIGVISVGLITVVVINSKRDAVFGGAIALVLIAGVIFCAPPATRGFGCGLLLGLGLAALILFGICMNGLSHI